MKIAINLIKLLEDVQSQNIGEFSGLGLLVYSHTASGLPVASLKMQTKEYHLPLSTIEETFNFLVDASSNNSKYHDGFHLLNENFQLTHLSQYIAPKIIHDIKIVNEFGSRYRTALYSSLLTNVIATGVVSNNYKATVFIKGKKY